MIPVGTLCLILGAVPADAEWEGRTCTVIGYCHEVDGPFIRTHKVRLADGRRGTASHYFLRPITPPPTSVDTDKRVPKEISA